MSKLESVAKALWDHDNQYEADTDKTPWEHAEEEFVSAYTDRAKAAIAACEAWERK